MKKNLLFLLLVVLGVSGFGQSVVFLPLWRTVLDSTSSNVDQIANFSSPTGGCTSQFGYLETPRIALSPSGSQVACIGMTNCNIMTTALNTLDGSTAFQDIYSGFSPETGVGVAYDKSSNLLALGGINVGAPSGVKNFLRKYDPTGTIMYTDLISNYTRDMDNMMRVDTSGRVHLANVSFNGTTNQHPLYCIDAGGVTVWSSVITDYDFFYAYPGVMEMDDSGNTVFTGKYQSSPSPSSYQVVVRKVDPNGATMWQVYYNAYPEVYADHIAIDHNGDIYMSMLANTFTSERLVKFSHIDGSVIWDVATSTGVADMKINTDGNLALVSNSTNLFYFNSSTGSVIWSKSLTSVQALGLDVLGRIYEVSTDSVRVYDNTGTQLGGLAVPISGYTTRINSVTIDAAASTIYLLGERSTPSSDKVFVAAFSICVPPTAGTIFGSPIVCLGSPLLFAESIPGGTWSVFDPTYATITPSSGVVTPVASGIDTIYYTITNACGTATASFPISVNPTPALTTSLAPSPVCDSALFSYVPASTVSGTTYNWSRPSIAGIANPPVSDTGSVNEYLHNTSPFPVIVNYVYTSTAAGCSNTQIVNVTVNPTPRLSSTLTPPSVCDSTLFSYNATSLTSGVTFNWSRGPVAGISNPTAAGFGNINEYLVNTTHSPIAVSYAYILIASGCFSSQTVVDTVYPYPYAGVITGADSICVGSLRTLVDTVAGGVWSGLHSHIAVSTDSVVGVAAGVDSVAYTVTVACGSATAYHPMTINPLPYAGTITGPSSVCLGSTIALTDAAPGGTWSASGGVSVSSLGVVSGATAGLGDVYYTVTNVCGTEITGHALTINVVPSVSPIAGPNQVCVGASITLTDPSTGGTWTGSNSSASVIAGIVSGLSAGAANISYTLTNVCGSTSAVRTVTVVAAPSAGAIAGVNFICPGDSLFIMTATVTGGIWTMTNGNAYIDALGQFAGAHAGRDTIVYTVTNMCGTASVEWPIVVIGADLCQHTGITPIGTKEARLNVFPNPNNGSFVVNLISQEEQAHFTVTNMLGQTINEFDQKTNQDIELQLNVAPGIYFVSARAGDKQFVEKVVVR